MKTRRVTRVAMAPCRVLAGCASNPNHLEGVNYGRTSDALVAAGFRVLPLDPTLPEAGTTLARRVILIGDAGNPTDNEVRLHVVESGRDTPELSTRLAGS